MSDVIAPDELPNWHIEVKGTTTQVLLPSMVTKWYDQVTRDCPSDKLPVLFWKANNKAPLCFVRGIGSFLTPQQDIVIKYIWYTAIKSESLFDSFEAARRINILNNLPAFCNIIVCKYYITDDKMFYVLSAEDLLKYRSLSNGIQLNSAVG